MKREFQFEGFSVMVRRTGRLFSWSAAATHPVDGLVWRSSSAWTPWGAKYDARWVISRFLLPGLEQRERETGEPVKIRAS